MSESKSFGKLRQILIGASMVGACFGQFSSYAPAYLIDTPQQFNYGSYPFINPLDPYLEIQKSPFKQSSSNPQSSSSHSFSFDSQLRKEEKVYQQTVVNRNDIPLGDFQYGGTGQDNPTSNFVIEGQQTSTCKAPRINIAGICRCPDNGVFLSGICFPRIGFPVDPVDPLQQCFWPRKMIDEKCRCPNDGIYTADGKCVEDSIGNGPCQYPRSIREGKCQCPENYIYLSGKCYQRDGSLFPTQPIGNNIQDLDSIEALSLIFRSYNGQGNHQINTKWGSKDSPLERRAPAKYQNGANKPMSYFPNPRTISNEYVSLKGKKPILSRNKVTMAFVIWGQFLDHDIDLTEAGKTESMNIDVPETDPFFHGDHEIEFKRSIFLKDDGFNPREYPNEITSWIDGSQVYGSDEATARFLRSFSQGKLRTSGQNLLPRIKNQSDGMFEAGDIRANENMILTSYHTLFMRQHNRVCDQIIAKGLTLNDQELYQAARHYVIGLLQKITVDQFLPIMMGIEYDHHFGPYTGYKAYLNPNIPIEFSTAGYRGHMLIAEQFPLLNRWGEVLEIMKLRDMFFRPNLVTDDSISQLFRGLSKTLMKQKSPELIDELRNLLVLDPSNREIKLDLFCLNIQRSRDHGLPTYNQARKAYGLKKVKHFTDIISDPVKAWELSNLYHGKIDDVELIVGVWSEKSVLGGVLGELGCLIVGQAFRNLRDGDRFWYENAYPPKVIQEIHNTKLSDVIKRNTDARDIQEDIFHYWEDQFVHY